MSKQQGTMFVRINTRGLQNSPHKVVRETHLCYEVIIDGHRESFFKEHCVIDRRAGFEAKKDRDAKAAMIGINKRKR